MRPNLEGLRQEMADVGYVRLESLFSLGEMVDLDRTLTDFETRLAREGLDEREVVFTQKIAERDDAVRAFAQRDEFVDLSTAFLGPHPGAD